MVTDNRMLRSALWYAKHGWHVFPIHAPIFNAAGALLGCSCEEWRHTKECEQFKHHLYLPPGEHCRQPGKCPAVRWAEKSTIDEETIYKWWGRDWRTKLDTGYTVYFTPNIGIDCGKSDLLVFDADAYKDFYQDDNLLTLDEKQTVTALTGGGGEHLVYARQGLPYGNSCKGLPKGIDIRGDGGYIVAAPSLHKSGRNYAWEYGYGPHEMEPRPVPQGLRNVLDKATRRRIGEALGEPDAKAVKESAALVEQLLKQANIAHHGAQEYGKGGRRWIIANCPFMPADSPHVDDNGTFVIVLEDGHIAAGCHHNRCQHTIADSGKQGWEMIKDLAVTVTPLHATARYPRIYRAAA